jgi:hypothetical protein
MIVLSTLPTVGDAAIDTACDTTMAYCEMGSPAKEDAIAPSPFGTSSATDQSDGPSADARMIKLPMTAAGYSTLENELNHRVRVERARLIQRIQEGYKFGRKF